MRSKALVVAYAVHETGVREVIDLGIGEVESGGFWIEFLRSLRARGLDGVQLAVSDHYEGSSTQSLRCSPAPGSLARCTSCALVLVTTNEPLQRLHPAVARPGRCLSRRMEFAHIETEADHGPPYADHALLLPRTSRVPSWLSDLRLHLYSHAKGPRKRAVGFAANRVGRRRGPLLTMSGSEAWNAKHVRA